MGSGCGSVGRVLDADFRGPWFESGDRTNFKYTEDEMKETRHREWPIFKLFLLHFPNPWYLPITVFSEFINITYYSILLDQSRSLFLVFFDRKSNTASISTI